MIQDILPPGVAYAESFAEALRSRLFPEEEGLLVNAVGKRRREFDSGRWCARRALADLGQPPVPLMPAPGGAPRWPAGFVGSITHRRAYCAAAVARAADLGAIGIDAEPDERLPGRVLNAVALAEERVALAQLELTYPNYPWDRLLFSAKESVYKAWFPLTGRQLRFKDVMVTLNPLDGRFRARLLGSERVTGDLSGGWLARAGLLLTSVTVAAEPRLPSLERGDGGLTASLPAVGGRDH